MLRILVVEDEPPILRSIVSTIKSCGEDFVVAGTAFNGKSAMEQIEKNEIEGQLFDLVLTDIRMPVMDGLELAENIYTCMPQMDVVVISGYHEFSYVQSALRSHVYDYLTKPVSKDAMKALLTRIDVMTSERKREAHEKKLLEAVTDFDVSHGDVTARYAPFLLCAGAFPTVPDNSMMPGRAFWHANDLNNIVKGTLHDGENCFCFDGKSESERIAVIETDSALRSRDIANELFAYFEKQDIFVTTIYPEKLYGLNEIGHALNLMRIKLQNSLKFLHISKIGEFEDVAVPALTDSGSEGVIPAMLSGNQARLHAALRTETERLVSVEATQGQISHYFKEIITKNNNRLKVGAEALNSYFYEVDYSLTNSVSAESFTDSLTYLLGNLLSMQKENENDKVEPPLIAQIEEYLKEHFTEDLTNAQLAQVFNFVPSYLSKLFRTYRGISPSEYLMKYRIRKAISLMEENPDMLIKEASSSVGLHDQYYFSKLFKKETGLCPSEYFGMNRKP